MCSFEFVHVEVFVVALCVSVVWFGVIVVVVFSDFVCPCLHFPLAHAMNAGRWVKLSCCDSGF